MGPTVELEIRFDGDTPGLAEHRLSLSHFMPALGKLLIAVRRMADVVARGDSAQERRRGYGSVGSAIDLQLATLQDGCVRTGFTIVLPMPDENARFDASRVAQEAVTRFVASIATEASGRSAASPSIRQFLNALPSGLRVQEYEARANGSVLGTAKLGPPANVGENRPLPAVREFRGRIVGARFDPHHGRVRIKDLSTGVTYTCRAVQELVDKAVELRRETVVGRILDNPGSEFKRLLAINSEGQVPPAPIPEARLLRIVEDWDQTLRKLAE